MVSAPASFAPCFEGVNTRTRWRSWIADHEITEGAGTSGSPVFPPNNHVGRNHLPGEHLP